MRGKSRIVVNYVKTQYLGENQRIIYLRAIEGPKNLMGREIAFYVGGDTLKLMLEKLTNSPQNTGE